MSNSPMQQYLRSTLELINRVAESEAERIQQAADVCASAILKGRLVHLFGSGHSRIPVEEIYPRYGSFPGFHPIVELSLTFHTQVVGANGQRQAMALENAPGLAKRILRNFVLSEEDAMVVFSNGGSNLVPIEMAEGANEIGMTTIAVTSLESNRANPNRTLADLCDIVIDNGVPPGDAVVWINGLETPVSPVSSVSACFIANALKAEVAERLTRAGQPPKVLTSPVHVGKERAAEMFEESYDDYRRRVGALYR